MQSATTTAATTNTILSTPRIIDGATIHCQGATTLSDEQSMHERALVIAVEARTLAQTAHDRQDSMEAQISAVRVEISDFKEWVAKEFVALREAVAKLNTKAGMAAGIGAAVASAAVGVVLHYLN